MRLQPKGKWGQDKHNLTFRPASVFCERKSLFNTCSLSGVEEAFSFKGEQQSALNMYILCN
jgi:hypothetical protein